MVAQSSANSPIFHGHARHRGRGFGALEQTLGRTAIPLIKKYLVKAAKRIGADLFEIAAPEIGDIFSGRKNSKHLRKMLEQKQTVRKQLRCGKKKSKRRTRRAISRKNSSKIIRSRKDIFDKKKRV